MSFPNPFNKQAQQQQPQVNLTAIENELDQQIDFFHKVMYACKKKCISNEYNSSELTQGEALCIDRCITKFNDAEKKISEKMQEQMGATAETTQEQQPQK